MDIKKSNVYTRGGDKGQTSLIGGRRVEKYHLRIEAYGSVDELMAHTSLLRDGLSDEVVREQLLKVLGRLMAAAAEIASDGGEVPESIPRIIAEDVVFLEEAIDMMDHALPPLKSFVLPGGDISSSQAHVARTVCRRTERILLHLASKEPLSELVLQYFNRLSDYYFLLSRKLVKDSDKNEMLWIP